MYRLMLSQEFADTLSNEELIKAQLWLDRCTETVNENILVNELSDFIFTPGEVGLIKINVKAVNYDESLNEEVGGPYSGDVDTATLLNPTKVIEYE